MEYLGDSLVPLDQLDDFEIADGDPDVRGWSVLSADGRKIGEVDTLLIDTNVMKVRYLDVELADDFLAGEDERHILVPVGYARLDSEDDQIFVDSLNSTRLVEIPAYRRQPVTPEYETSLRGYFDSRAADPGLGDRGSIDFLI